LEAAVQVAAPPGATPLGQTSSPPEPSAGVTAAVMGYSSLPGTPTHTSSTARKKPFAWRLRKAMWPVRPASAARSTSRVASAASPVSPGTLSSTAPPGSASIAAGLVFTPLQRTS